LEGTHRHLGLGAEDPVDPSGVESEVAQPQLEVGNVVAPEHGPLEAEQSAPDLEAGFDERRPGRQIADAGDRKVPLTLEPPDSVGGPRVVAADIVRRRVTPSLEPALQVGDVIA
jgi:hypothetical protein